MRPPTLYVMDISYFSGKVESYLRYKEIPYRRETVTHRTLVGYVGKRTGVAQVPAMELDDGTWLRESSTMIRWLEERHPSPPIISTDPVEAFIGALIEDYCDEWLWRPAMWWRWVPETTRRHLGRRIAREVLHDLPAPSELLARFFARRQHVAWLSGDGMTREGSRAVCDAYPVELRSLEQILAERPFLGGERPSIVDIGFMGPMFRHFACDPDSAIVMRRDAPRVWAWVARTWATRGSELAADATHRPTQGLGFDEILDRVCQIYLPYLRANALALSKGEARFDFEAGPFRFRGTRSNAHRAWCRSVLRDRFAALEPEHQSAVQAQLKPHGGLGALLDEDLSCPAQSPPLELPLAPREHTSVREVVGLWLGDSFGTQRG